MSMLEYLKTWEWLPSREGKQVYASNSEKRRWIERGSVEIDGEKATLTTAWPDELSRIVIHPKGKHRTTLQ